MPTSAVPIFRIFDYKKTIEFYVDWLGFKVDWEHKFGDDSPIYMQVSRDGIVLHLSEHHGDCSPGSKAYIEVDDVRNLYKKFAPGHTSTITLALSKRPGMRHALR